MDEKTCDRDINRYLSEPHASKIYQKKKIIPESCLPCFLCHMPDSLLCNTDKTNYVHHG